MLDNTDLRKMKEYIQHGNTDTLLHSVAVAHFSYLLAKALRINIRLRPLIVGALLHDYYLYDWHVPDRSHNWHGFRHPFTSAKMPTPTTASVILKRILFLGICFL